MGRPLRWRSTRAPQDPVSGDSADREWERVTPPACCARKARSRRLTPTDSSAGRSGRPPGAQEIDIDHFYERLDEEGYGYGPNSRACAGCSRPASSCSPKWRLPESQIGQAQDFASTSPCGRGPTPGAARDRQRLSGGVPFAFSGVRLLARGASSLLLRAESSDRGTLSLAAIDERGEPALVIESVTPRVVDKSELKAAQEAGREAMYEPDWVELAPAAVDEDRSRVAVSRTRGRDPSARRRAFEPSRPGVAGARARTGRAGTQRRARHRAGARRGR